MKTHTLKKKGGLIVKKKFLESIFVDPKVEGIAFAVTEPGVAKDVNLNVMAVYNRDNVLVAEKVENDISTAAPSPLQYPVRDAGNFNFKHSNKLKKDKFSFGFYNKGSFQLLIKGKEDLDEVFIGGAKKNFGDTDIVGKLEWFTLVLSLRKNVDTISYNALGKHNSFSQDTEVGLPKPNKKSVISINALEKHDPLTFNGRRKVRSIILGGINNSVKGVVFEDEPERPIVFRHDKQIVSVLLTEQQAIRKMYVLNSKSEVIDVEEDNIGLYPNADHTTPCPPHWPEDQTEESDVTIQNTVANAVFECMKIG